MLDKVKNRLKKIHSISKMIIKYGLFICTLILIVAIFLPRQFADTYYLFISQELIKVSFIIMLEIVIGAIAIDCYAI